MVNIKPLVTIIIPTHNSESTLPKVLESLLTIELDKKLVEIIIVDEGSNDNTLRIIKEFAEYNADKFYKIKIIRFNENIGVSHARNVGIKQANGRFIFLLDSDVLLKKGTLSRLMELCKNDVGAVSALYLHEHPDLAEKVNYYRYLNRVAKGDILTGAALLRNEVIKKIGYFNESLGYPYTVYEDWEYTMRVRKAGYKTLIDGRDPLLHLSKNDLINGTRKNTKKIKILNMIRRFKTYFTYSKAKALYQVMRAAPNRYRCEYAFYSLVDIFLIVTLALNPLFFILGTLILILSSILYYINKYDEFVLRLLGGPLIVISRLARALSLLVYILLYVLVHH